MHKYWVVLKVSLTRPWVWLMLFFGLFQVFPLAMFWSQDKLRETKVAIPAFDVPDVVVSQTQEIQELARQNRLGTIEGLNTRDLHGEVLFESNGQPRASAEMLAQPRQADQMGGWPLLELMPQLQSLEMVPPNGLPIPACRIPLKIAQSEHKRCFLASARFGRSALMGMFGGYLP